MIDAKDTTAADLFTTAFEQVEQFHRHFEFPLPASPQLLDEGILVTRVKFLEEEINELILAQAEGDVVGIMDAVLDLVYVAIGTGLYAGITGAQLKAGFDAVHAANMRKVKVASAAESKRNTPFDAKKPIGWQGPEPTLARLLGLRSK